MDNYKGLAHIGVFTNDVKASLDFYEKLGAVFIKQGDLMKPEGPTTCILLNLHGVTLELIHPSVPAPQGDGSIAHIALLVDDVDAAAAELMSRGVNSFVGDAKSVSPQLLGGLENWFFTGPSGETLELIKMY